MQETDDKIVLWDCWSQIDMRALNIHMVWWASCLEKSLRYSRQQKEENAVLRWVQRQLL